VQYGSTKRGGGVSITSSMVSLCGLLHPHRRSHWTTATRRGIRASHTAATPAPPNQRPAPAYGIGRRSVQNRFRLNLGIKEKMGTKSRSFMCFSGPSRAQKIFSKAVSGTCLTYGVAFAMVQWQGFRLLQFAVHAKCVALVAPQQYSFL
jgi:hypothetical protein